MLVDFVGGGDEGLLCGLGTRGPHDGNETTNAGHDKTKIVDIGSLRMTNRLMFWNRAFRLMIAYLLVTQCFVGFCLSLCWRQHSPETGKFLVTTRQKVTFLPLPRPQTTERLARMSILFLSSWLALDSRVYLVASRETFDPHGWVLPVLERVHGLASLRLLGDLPTGYDGRPLVREWFLKGFEAVREGYICFLNADIYVTRQWLQVARNTFDSLPYRERVLIFGTRSDVFRNISVEKLDPLSQTLLDDLDNYCTCNFNRDYEDGMDAVFVHSSFNRLNWTEFPDYVIGLCWWDRFFQGWANHRCETVAMMFCPRLFHIDHGGNACNVTNFRYFSQMGHLSGLGVRYEKYDLAVWHFVSGQFVVRNRVTGRVVRVVRPLDALTPGTCPPLPCG